MASALNVVSPQNVGTLAAGQPNVAGAAQVQGQPPQFGNVTAVGTTVSTDVLWAATGVLQTVTHPDLASSGLDIIEDASAIEIARLTGAWVRRVFGGARSAEFQGRVCGVYRRTPNGATAGSGPIFALAQSEDGRGGIAWLEDLAANFEVVPGR